jgi:hypothetical protein
VRHRSNIRGFRSRLVPAARELLDNDRINPALVQFNGESQAHRSGSHDQY